MSEALVNAVHTVTTLMRVVVSILIFNSHLEGEESRNCLSG